MRALKTTVLFLSRMEDAAEFCFVAVG